MYLMCERRMTFSYGLRIIVSSISPYVDDLTILHDLIWVDQYSFIFLWSICFSHGIRFILPTLIFIHIDLHSMFNIFHTSFLYIPSAIRYYSFVLFHHWYIHLDSFFITDIFTLDVLRSMIYETLCTYCILHIRVRILIIGYLSLVSFHFFHPITLAYVTSRVLRPP